VVKLRDRISVSKRARQKYDLERFARRTRKGNIWKTESMSLKLKIKTKILDICTET
jgi:hypothetical protein